MKNNPNHPWLRTFVCSIVLLFVSTVSSAQVTGTIELKAFHNSSATATSNITYYVTLSNGWQQGISSITNTVLKNKTTGNTVYSSATAYNIPYGTIPTALSPAYYELTLTISTKNGKNFVSVTAIQTIWIGNKVMWENCFDMEPGVSQYSMKRSRSTVGQTYSYAQSFNQLPQSTYGWVEMQKPDNITNDSRVFLVLENLTDPRTFTASSNITYLEFYRDNSTTTGVRLKYKNGTTYTTTNLTATGFVPTDKVRFVRNSSGTCVIEASTSSNNQITLFTFPIGSTINPTNLQFTLLAKQLDDRADNIITSYAYPNTNYPISTDYESSNSSNAGMGTITTHIAPLSGFSSPYNYFITETPMDDMKSIYKYLKDSIYTQGVDSTTFFQGTVAGTSNTSQLLPSGSYYTNVFDSKGVRIFTNKYDLRPTSIIGQQNAIWGEYNEFLSTAPEAYATFDTYITDKERVVLDYSFANTSPDQIVGVLAEYDVINGGTNWYAKIKYGFYIQNGLYQTIVNGALSSTASISANDLCQLVFENGNIYFLKNGSVVRTETAPSSYDYRSAAYSKGWGVLIHFLPMGAKFRPYKIGISVTDNACDKNSGDLAITFSGYQGASVSGVNFSLKNITTDPSSPTTVYSNITTNASYGDLASGVYLLEGQLTVGGVSHTNIRRVIYVGSKLSWDPVLNIQTPASGYENNAISTSSVTGNNGNVGAAIATNKLPASTAGWVVFTPVISPNSTTFSGKTTRMTFSESPIIQSIATYNPMMPSVAFKGAVAYTSYSAGGSASVSLTDYAPGVPFLVNRLSNGNVTFRQNLAVLRTVTNFYNGRWKPSLFTHFANTGVISALASFPCSSYSTNIYAHLEYEMDGYYHVMDQCNLNFLYNEEYNNSTLKFNIYTDDMIKMYDQDDFPAVNIIPGENRISLYIGGPSICLTNGHHILEVINAKNERFFLRFINNNCPSCAQGGGH